MKFSSKLILSFTLVTFLLLVIGVSSQYLNNRIKDRLVEESERAIQELELSGEMGILLYRSLINTQYFLEDRYRKNLNKNFGEADLNIEQAQIRVRRALGDFSESLSATEKILNLQDQGSFEQEGPRKLSIAILDQLKSKFEIYASLVDQLIFLTTQDYNDGKEFFTVTIEPYFRTNLLPLVDRLREETQRNLDQEIARLNMELSEMSKILALATAGALALSLVLAYFLYRSIAPPLRRLALAAQRIGAGNLNERIKINSRDEIGQLGAEFNKMAESLSKTTVSKDFMDDIIESMADALIVTDEDSRIRRINSATMEMLGYPEKELVGKPIAHVFPERQSPEIGKIQLNNIFKNYETSYRTKSGKLVPVSLSRALMHDSNGGIRGLVCVASDITQRKKAEEQISKSLKEKEVLLAEIHHRVKNNLAVISGLLQMQIWETNNEIAEMALKDSQLRVLSIALVHEKLYQSENLSFIKFDKYIHDLLQAISDTYMDASFPVNVETDLAAVILNINQAIPCSLLLNELIVNAYKYAFRGKSEGLITVKLWKDEGTDTIFLKVKDNGPGLPESFNFDESQTLGMSLVGTLVCQLNGDIKIRNDQGAVFEISFPQEEVG